MSLEALRWADEQQVHGSAGHLLYVLAGCARKDDGVAYPSAATLTERTGMTGRTLRSATERLESLGLIEVVRRTGRAGNRYHLKVVSYSTSSDDPEQVSYDTTSGSEQVPYDTTSRREQVPNSTSSPGGEQVPNSTSSGPELVPYDTSNRCQTAPRTSTRTKRTTALVRDRPHQPTPAAEQRGDVEQLCRRLRDRIVENGNREPAITATWRREARLLLDRDGIELARALRVLDWCQNDRFWKSNILSMPKFREKYDQLRGRATDEWERQHRGHAKAERPIDPKTNRRWEQ